MYHIFCIDSSVEGHLGSFQLLAIINKGAINIVEHVSFLLVATSSGYMPRSGIAGSEEDFFKLTCTLIPNAVIYLNLSSCVRKN